MRYAHVEDGIVTNVIEADEGYVPPFGEVIALQEAVSVSEQGLKNMAVSVSEQGQNQEAVSVSEQGQNQEAVSVSEQGLKNMAVSVSEQGLKNMAVSVSEQGMQNQAVGIGWKYESGSWIAPEIEIEPVSFPPLSPRQLRLALSDLDKLQDLENIVASLPPKQREKAEIEWEYATSFRRDHPLIIQFAPILGFSEEETDALWLQAAQIED